MNSTQPRIAYFSMEVGLADDLPTYSGGLGILAGDTLRAAADLGLPMVGVTLVHREGYTRQRLDADGNQTDEPLEWDPADRLAAVPFRIAIDVGGHEVSVAAWRYDVVGATGAVVPVYLLDTELPENRPGDRELTDRLYGGDDRYRLAQETVLGYGGVALLRALGYTRIHTYHMNEGHCALVPLALLEERIGRHGFAASSRRHDRGVRLLCVFTTHTPVASGHDRFGAEVVAEVLGEERAKAILGRFKAPHRQLNMSELALHFSRFTNGVALRHAQVAREMFPGRAIHAITNGVHVRTWAAPATAALFDAHIPEWREDALNLRHTITIPLDEVIAAAGHAKGDLAAQVLARNGVALDPGVFTIGFARRATGYKRADLVFDDAERLEAIAREFGGLQLVFGGKAHPRDFGGKELIRRIVALGREIGPAVKVVYLEEYDMALARTLIAGVDLWLNNPQKPLEASGTSGMKAALNGVPSLSVLDGWWIEGHVEGVTGWSIDERWEDEMEREAEAAALYDKLERVILPLYRDDPEGYARVRRQAIALNGPAFSATRMMLQYVERPYGGFRKLGPRSARAPVRPTMP